MKLPPSLVIGMLATSILAPLVAASYWWVMWPERTAREFVTLMALGQTDDAKPMTRLLPYCLVDPEQIDFDDLTTWCPDNLLCESRTLWDMVTARQQFTIRTDLKMDVCGSTVKELWCNGRRARIRWPGNEPWQIDSR